MPLTEAQKKRISDVAKGNFVNSKMRIEDQIAAIRKQIDLILKDNPKIPIDDDYKILSDLTKSIKSAKK